MFWRPDTTEEKSESYPIVYCKVALLPQDVVVCWSDYDITFTAGDSGCSLEKLIVAHLVKRFPDFCETWWFITTFAKACQWALFQSRWIESTHLYHICLKSIFILFWNLCLVVPNGFFPLCCLTNILYAFFIPHACYMPYTSRFSWFDHPSNTCWTVQIIKVHINWEFYSIK
jgi:hypothetical protein